MPRTIKGAWRSTELDIVRALRKISSGTLHEIGSELDLSHKWVARKIIILREAGKVYISGWQKKHSQGPYRPVFSLREDDEEDEPKPLPVSDSEKTRNCRERKKLKGLIFHEHQKIL